MPAQILNTPISNATAELVDTAKNVRGLTAEDTLDQFTTAQRIAQRGAPEMPSQQDLQEIVGLLRDLTSPLSNPFDGRVLQDISGHLPLGIHMGGVTGAIEHCPFGRTYVGIDSTETDLNTLVEATYAEWRTAQTHRDLVVIFRQSIPRLAYVDVEWDDSPVLYRGQPRDLKGRHFISNATVINLTSAAAAQHPELLTTTRDQDDMVSFQLTPTSTTLNPDLITYLRTHQRMRPTLQQPIDKLDIG